MSRPRDILVGLALSSATLVLIVAALVAVDLYGHHRLAPFAGWNAHGYRGRILGRKGPTEIRVAALGGSTTYGYAVAAGQSYPDYLERELRRRMAPGVTISVVNLGFNNDGAVCFADTVKAYDYLGPDIFIIYSGINDAPGYTIVRQPADCGRMGSWVFRTSGYLPIGDLLVREKYYQLRYGSVDKGYLARSPGLARQLATWREGLESKWREEARRTVRQASRPVPALGGRDRLYRDEEAVVIYGSMIYKKIVVELVRSLLARGTRVIVAPQPFFGDTFSTRRYQQALLRAAVDREFGTDPRFRYADLGDLFTRREQLIVTTDGMHLNAAGNERLARAFVEPVLDLARRLAIARAERRHR